MDSIFWNRDKKNNEDIGQDFEVRRLSSGFDALTKEITLSEDYSSYAL